MFESHVPCAPVMRLAEVVNDSHYLERGMWQDIEHPEKGTVRVFGNPIRFSENKERKLVPAPLLGEDNDAVYRELLGMEQEQIDMLRKQRVI